MFRRLIASLICFTFSFSNLQYVQAQDFSVNQLPIPGTMVGESTPFAPLALKGLVVNPQKPLEFQFIVDTGRGPQDTASIKDQANQLVKYFLAGLTIPEGDLWVNLSPYEKNRMVPEALGQTDLGRDLLAQDYILKQLTASLIYPEKDLGKEFWSRVYAKAQQQFGTTNIPVNTFNKVWILPDQAQVYENVNAAYVTKSTLKVMLDEDYTALQKHMTVRNGTDSIGSQIVRQIILPEIEKEVNTGKNFAPLRQIYQALILAKWYKETIQNGLLDAIYTNKNKVAGVNLSDPTVKEQIYERYLKAYKKGAFNYIKEDPTPDGQAVPRKYFSGGTNFENIEEVKDNNPADIHGDGAMAALIVNLSATQQPSNAAMLNFSNAVAVKDEMNKNWNYFYNKTLVPGVGAKIDTSTFKDFFIGPGTKRFLSKMLGRFGIQYNPRRMDRRPPVKFTGNVFQQRGPGFDFTKADGERPADSSFRKVVINGVPVEITFQPKPFSRLGHLLVFPRRDELKEQFLIPDAIKVALGMIKDSPKNEHLKVAFNSMGAFGTVNHLHLQVLWNESLESRDKDEPQAGPMAIENFENTPMILNGDPITVNGVTVNEVKDYPAKVFVLESSNIESMEKSVANVVGVLQRDNQPHNVIFTKNKDNDQLLRAYIFPRNVQETSSFGIGTGVAFFELMGELIVTLKNSEDRDEQVRGVEAKIQENKTKLGFLTEQNEIEKLEKENTNLEIVSQMLAKAKTYDEITPEEFSNELKKVSINDVQFNSFKKQVAQLDKAMSLSPGEKQPPDAVMLEARKLLQDKQVSIAADDGQGFEFSLMEGYTNDHGVNFDDYFRISVSRKGILEPPISFIGPRVIAHIDVKGTHMDLSFESGESMVYRDVAFQSKGREIGYRGIGRTLLALAMAISKLNGYHEFVANDVTEGTEAFKLYIGLGFSKRNLPWKNKDLEYNLKQPLPMIKIEKIRDKAMNAKELISVLKDAESKMNFEEYNRISDLLHQMGHSEGNYIYKFQRSNLGPNYELLTEAELDALPEFWRNPGSWQKIERFDSTNMLKTPEQKQKVIVVWQTTGQVNKIVPMLDDIDKSVRQTAMDAVDKTVTDPNKKLPILIDALYSLYYDVRSWAINEVDGLVTDPEKKLSILVSQLEMMEKIRVHNAYNGISDFLHKHGHPKGNFVFENVEIRAPRGSYNDGDYDPGEYEWQLQPRPRDYAMLETSKMVSKITQAAENGGIDLNQINLLRNGKTVNVQFDPAQLSALEQGGFEGFSPIITSITRILSPFQLLGVDDPAQSS